MVGQLTSPLPGPRLLILSTEFPPGPGGIGTHAWEAARRLRMLGWEVLVRTCQDYVVPSEASRFSQRAEFEIRSLKGARLPGVRLPYLLAGLLQDCLFWKPDAVLASGRNAILAGWLLRGKPKLAAVAHGTELLTGGRFHRHLVQQAFNGADLVFAVSRYTAGKLRERGVHRPKVEVIPNGADEEVFEVAGPERCLAIRRELGLGQGPAILTVGRVSERKGQWVVVRALKAVAEKVPEVEYWIAGLPGDIDRLDAEARAVGVAHRVRLLGQLPRETLVQVVQACDVFAMTSVMTADGDFEGYGIAVVEAALCGKPAVVSDSGGLPEAVADGETGIVVEEGDEAQTARALIRLLTDERLRRCMGEKARQNALKEGTWSARMRYYDRSLRELVGVGG